MKKTQLIGSDNHNRRGVITLELILWLPVILILLAAMLEFGLILSNYKHIQFASRMGAKVAAEELTSDITKASGNPGASIDAVEAAASKVLSSVDIALCQVILEQNISTDCVADNNTQTSGNCPNCGPPSVTFPTSGIGGEVPGGSVRVTLCVELSEVTPNLLAFLGFSTTGRTINASTIFPYENCIEFDPGGGAMMTPRQNIPDSP